MGVGGEVALSSLLEEIRGMVSVNLSLPLDGYLYLDDIWGSMLEIAFSIVIGVGIAVMIYLYEYGERDD